VRVLTFLSASPLPPLFHSHSKTRAKIFVPVRISVLTLWYILIYNDSMSDARPADLFNLRHSLLTDWSAAFSQFGTESPESLPISPLTPLFPLDTRIRPVSPLFPLDTKMVGGTPPLWYDHPFPFGTFFFLLFRGSEFQLRLQTLAATGFNR